MNASSVTLDKVMPLLTVREGVMVSRRGEVTVGWEVTLPTAYSLDEDEYADIVQVFSSSMRILPHWTMMHRQDVFLYDSYRASVDGRFLHDSYETNFHGRRFLTHRQYLWLSCSSKASALKPNAASAAFGIRFNSKLPSENDVRLFLSKAEEFISALTASGRISARRITQDELLGDGERAGLIQRYMMLGDDGPLLSDIRMAPDSVRVHDSVLQAFVVAEAENLPGEVDVRSRVESLCGPSNQVFLSYGAPLGVGLDCEHVVNQYILVAPQNHILSELEKKRKKMVSMSSSADNRVNSEDIGSFIETVHRDSLTVVYAHMNVLAWSTADKVMDVRGKVGSALTMMGILAVQDIYDVPVLYLSGIPGAGCELGSDNLMLMEMCSALCLGTYETFERDLEGGLFRICDRMRNIPLTIDVQRRARDMGYIDNYNMFVLGPSGTGKSFFTNFFLRSCYDAGEHVFVIDVGDSYEGLCEIINEESCGRDGLYHSWDVDHPFSFNAFIGCEEWLDASGNLRQDSSGATFLMSFLQTLWAPLDGWTSDRVPVLRQMVTDFVSFWLSQDRGCLPVFDDLCCYLRDVVQPQVLSGTYKCGGIGVGTERFDIVSMLLALQPYSLSGGFSFLLNDRNPKDLFSSRFTVFEVDRLSQVEDSKFYSLCVLCIMNAFDIKMRSLPTFKVMVIEEAWKAIANETMAPYLKGLWKTSRKFQTCAMVVTQQITDITSSDVIKDAILKNSDVKVLLDQSGSQNSFDDLTELLGLSEKEKNIILSMNRANNPDYRYREVFIKMNSRCGVYATEASPQEAMAFESDKVRKKPLYERAKAYGSIVDAISSFVAEKRTL